MTSTAATSAALDSANMTRPPSLVGRYGARALALETPCEKALQMLKRSSSSISSRWTRREAIRLMGAGGAGFVTACGGRPDPAAPVAETAGEGPIVDRMTESPIIRTLLGDISPDRIDGVTLFHEHLSIKLSDQMTATDDVDHVVQEIRAASGEGVGCIVDGGHQDMARDLDACRRVAAETDVHVVASGGYYMERFYPADLATKSDETIAEELVEEAVRDQLGAFGEIGQTSDAAEMSVRTSRPSRGWCSSICWSRSELTPAPSLSAMPAVSTTRRPPS